MVLNNPSMLKFSLADAGTMRASGNSPCHLSTSASSASGVVRSILLMTTMAGTPLWRMRSMISAERSPPLHGVGDIEYDVGVGYGARHEFHHRLL